MLGSKKKAYEISQVTTAYLLSVFAVQDSQLLTGHAFALQGSWTGCTTLAKGDTVILGMIPPHASRMVVIVVVEGLDQFAGRVSHGVSFKMSGQSSSGLTYWRRTFSAHSLSGCVTCRNCPQHQSLEIRIRPASMRLLTSSPASRKRSSATRSWDCQFTKISCKLA